MGPGGMAGSAASLYEQTDGVCCKGHKVPVCLLLPLWWHLHIAALLCPAQLRVLLAGGFHVIHVVYAWVCVCVYVGQEVGLVYVYVLLLAAQQQHSIACMAGSQPCVLAVCVFVCCRQCCSTGAACSWWCGWCGVLCVLSTHGPQCVDQVTCTAHLLAGSCSSAPALHHIGRGATPASRQAVLLRRLRSGRLLVLGGAVLGYANANVCLRPPIPQAVCSPVLCLAARMLQRVRAGAAVVALVDLGRARV
jgi:hypothetical protein